MDSLKINDVTKMLELYKIDFLKNIDNTKMLELKINEITQKLRLCEIERDEARRARLKAEDYEDFYFFEQNIKNILTSSMKLPDVIAREYRADLESNESLLHQTIIERLVCEHVANTAQIIENLRDELKKQRHCYEKEEKAKPKRKPKDVMIEVLHQRFAN